MLRLKFCLIAGNSTVSLTVHLIAPRNYCPFKAWHLCDDLPEGLVRMPRDAGSAFLFTYLNGLLERLAYVRALCGVERAIAGETAPRSASSPKLDCNNSIARALPKTRTELFELHLDECEQQHLPQCAGARSAKARSAGLRLERRARELPFQARQMAPWEAPFFVERLVRDAVAIDRALLERAPTLNWR